MKSSFIVIAAVLCLALAFVEPNCFAQIDDEMQYSYGEAISVSESQILVREFDFISGEEKDVLYYLNADTIYDVVIAGDQILPGDLVDIEFLVMRDGSRLVREILVDRIDDEYYQDFIE
jgi:hypothetical protein